MIELNDSEARDIVRALAVYARSLAEPAIREQNRAEIKRLDALRHALEAAIDKAE